MLRPLNATLAVAQEMRLPLQGNEHGAWATPGHAGDAGLGSWLTAGMGDRPRPWNSRADRALKARVDMRRLMYGHTARVSGAPACGARRVAGTR